MGLLCVLLMLASSVAADWPQWRGPNRDGIVHSFDIPAEWPDEMELVWREKVGTGYSSPVVAEGAVFTFTRDGDKEVLRKFDLSTGKSLWKSDYDAPSDVDWYGSGNHPKSTPSVSGNRIVTLGILGTLICWDTETGQQVWRKTFHDEFQETYPKFGAAVSPLIVGDRLYIHCGGKMAGEFKCLSLQTGDVIWSWDGDSPGYSSPILVETGGTKQLVAQSDHLLFSLDANDGSEFWRIPFSTPHDQNVITPVVAGDLIVHSGYDSGTHAIRLREDRPDSVWSQTGIHQYMGSPVSVDGLVIGFDHKQKGRLFCLDASTGDVLWLTHGRWGQTASVVAVGSHLAVLSTDGQLSFSEISRDAYRTSAYYTMSDSETWAHPAFSDNVVVIKDSEHVSVWRF